MEYGTSGWNGILKSNTEKIYDHLHTGILATLGEDVQMYEALHLSSDGKWCKPEADGPRQGATGLVIEDGNLDDTVRILRIGPITNGSLWWTVGGCHIC